MPIEQFPTTLCLGTAHETPILARFVEPFTGPAATVISFAGGRVETMAGPTYRHSGDHAALLLVGYHASWDLPASGDDHHPGETTDTLSAWCQRTQAGEPFVENFAAKCVALLDDMVARQYTDPQRVAVVGHSRGALLAAHWAAIDPRISTLVLVQPLVNPITLAEWAVSPAVSPLCAGPLALAPIAHRIADRRMYVAIGDHDTRVNTASVLSFTQQLQDWSTDVTVNVFPETAPGHGPTPDTVLEDAADWLAAQMQSGA